LVWHKDSVKEGEYGGSIMYSCMKINMEAYWICCNNGRKGE
jgi:hypothetical protein